LCSVQVPPVYLAVLPPHSDSERRMSSVPRIDSPPRERHGRLHTIPGQVPAATAWPAGCRFHPRCAYAWDRCRQEEPPLLDAGAGEPGTHTVRCWLLTEPRRRMPRPSRFLPRPPPPAPRPPPPPHAGG